MENLIYKRASCENYEFSPFPRKPRIAMAYVPYQQSLMSIYTPERGLEAGTLFPNLDKPFKKIGGK